MLESRASVVQTYISLGLGLTVVGFGGGYLRSWIHLVLQLGDLVGQLLQGLHDVGSLLGLHPSVLLQAVYQGLQEEEQTVRKRKDEK